MQYYYLAASLPLLRYEERHAAEPQEFLALLAAHLGPRELAEVARARLGPPVEIAGIALLQRWLRFERGLRNALVRVRAARRGGDPAAWVRRDADGSDDTDASVSEVARQAMELESPLSTEEALSRARWTFLDELETGHYFDLERLIIHYLRLQILARRRSFARVPGEERFRESTATIVNQYYQER